MRVLVTGLFEMAALHAIRRFGQMGYEVHVAEGHRLAFSGFSKYVSKRLRVPNMRHHPAEYTQRIVSILESGDYDYYFPSYEEIIPMSRYRDRILAVTKSVIPTTETLMRLHDKKNLEALAHEIGLDSPKTFYPQSFDEARDYIANVELPVVIKMRKTSGAAGFRKIYDRAHFERTYFDVVKNNDLSESELPMIQQLIEGPTTCSLHLCNHGTVIGEVMYQGLRTMPRTGGTTVFRESVSDPASEAAAAKIVEHLDFSGLCGFDFILDTHTGRPFLVDGNCRITPAVTMAYHGGCDLIEAWVRVANGEETPVMPETTLGVRTKMQFADFIWLLESYMGSLKDWKGEHRLRKEWWSEEGYFYDIHSFSDPMPNLMIWIYIVTNCYKLIFTKFDSAQLFIFHNQYVEHENAKEG
jgi:predicted ATP-grasp superfamily ATP-dependent carboligase